jgi:hypothetical protein
MGKEGLEFHGGGGRGGKLSTAMYCRIAAGNNLRGGHARSLGGGGGRGVSGWPGEANKGGGRKKGGYQKQATHPVLRQHLPPKLNALVLGP